VAPLYLHKNEADSFVGSDSNRNFSTASSVSALDYTRSIESIAGDIADLRGGYPQLKDFSVARNLKADEHRISYG